MPEKEKRNSLVTVLAKHLNLVRFVTLDDLVPEQDRHLLRPHCGRNKPRPKPFRKFVVGGRSPYSAPRVLPPVRRDHTKGRRHSKDARDLSPCGMSGVLE